MLSGDGDDVEAMENKEITVMTVIPTPIDTKKKKKKNEQLSLIQFLRYSFIHFRFYRFISMIWARLHKNKLDLVMLAWFEHSFGQSSRYWFDIFGGLFHDFDSWFMVSFMISFNRTSKFFLKVLMYILFSLIWTNMAIQVNSRKTVYR